MEILKSQPQKREGVDNSIRQADMLAVKCKYTLSLSVARTKRYPWEISSFLIQQGAGAGEKMPLF